MSTIRVCNLRGETVGEAEFPDALLVFDRGDQALHEVVVAFRAAQRAGTASTKTKGEVAGSRRKPWRQKGTGRARAGIRQSPVWRGGSVAFGPRPRGYRKRVPRKVARLAFRRAVGDKVASGSLVALEEQAVLSGKSAELIRLLQGLGSSRGGLLLLGEPQPACAQAARNLPQVAVCTVADVHPYEILKHSMLVLGPGALARLQDRLLQAAGRQA